MGGAKTDYRPCRDADGQPSLAITVDCSAAVVSSDPGQLPHEALLRKLDGEFDRWIEERTEAALALWRESGADFLELGRHFSGETVTPDTLRVVTDCRGRVERSYDILIAENAPEDESHG